MRNLSITNKRADIEGMNVLTADDIGLLLLLSMFVLRVTDVSKPQ